MPVAQRRTWVEADNTELSVNQQCQLIGLPKSSFYYQKKVDSSLDDAMMKVIDQLYLQDCTFGTRRYKEELKDYGYFVGRQKVRSLMRTMGICAVYAKPRTTVIDPTKYKYPYLLRNYKTSRPNEVWSIDISYIPMRKGFMYLFVIIDVHSRYVVDWGISNTMEAKWVVEIIKRAVKKHGKPAIINSDQGSQFTSDEYVNTIKGFKDILISMDGKGRALDNVWVERFFRTIKYEYIYLTISDNGKELEQNIRYFVNYYNNHRKHSSLQYKTPASIYLNRPLIESPTPADKHSNRRRKNIACLHECQGQALRVANWKNLSAKDFSSANLDIRSALLMLDAKRYECHSLLHRIAKNNHFEHKIFP